MMPYLTYHFTENNDITENDQLKRLKIKIKVENYEEGNSYIWDLNKFHERYFMIKELLDTYFETNEIPKMKKE
jgi:kinesin family protein 13